MGYGTNDQKPGPSVADVDPNENTLSLYFGDIDGEGLYELVAATSDGWVYAWDTPGQALPGRADWPMRNVSARNTGVFGDPGASGEIFWEGFESGDTGRWSLTVP